MTDEMKEVADKLSDNICPDCGGIKDKRTEACKSCSKKGEKNPQWKGNEAGDGAKRKRGRYLKTEDNPTECEICGKEKATGIIRHHIDGDQSNNDQSNFLWLCRSCHFKVHNPNFGQFREWNNYELECYFSTDGKNTVHFKADNPAGIKKGLEVSMKVFEMIKGKYGTKADMWGKVMNDKDKSPQTASKSPKTEQKADQETCAHQQFKVLKVKKEGPNQGKYFKTCNDCGKFLGWEVNATA